MKFLSKTGLSQLINSIKESLSNKQDKLNVGSGIDITDNVISTTSPLKNKIITLLGDSLAVNYYSTPYPELIQLSTGCIMHNLAVAGATLASNSDNCIQTQLASIQSDTECIVIQIGGNDYLQQLEIGTNSDSTWTTYKGALKNAINYCRNNFPQARLLFVTCPHILQTDDDEYQRLLLTYIDAMLEICSLYSVPCLNSYSCLGLTPSNESLRSVYYQDDCVHFTLEGQKVMANVVENFILNQSFNNNLNAVTLNGYKLSVLEENEYNSLVNKDAYTIYITKNQKAYLGAVQILGENSNANSESESNLFDISKIKEQVGIVNYTQLSNTSYTAVSDSEWPAYVSFRIENLKQNTNYKVSYDMQSENDNFNKWFIVLNSADSEILVNSNDNQDTFNSGSNQTVFLRMAVSDGSIVTQNTCTFSNIKVEEVEEVIE